MSPLLTCLLAWLHSQDLHRVANGRQRIAQLMSQRCQKLVFAQVGLLQRALRQDLCGFVCDDGQHMRRAAVRALFCNKARMKITRLVRRVERKLQITRQAACKHAVNGGIPLFAARSRHADFPVCLANKTCRWPAGCNLDCPIHENVAQTAIKARQNVGRMVCQRLQLRRARTQLLSSRNALCNIQVDAGHAQWLAQGTALQPAQREQPAHLALSSNHSKLKPEFSRCAFKQLCNCLCYTVAVFGVQMPSPVVAGECAAIRLHAKQPPGFNRPDQPARDQVPIPGAYLCRCQGKTHPGLLLQATGFFQPGLGDVPGDGQQLQRRTGSVVNNAVNPPATGAWRSGVYRLTDGRDNHIPPGVLAMQSLEKADKVALFSAGRCLDGGSSCRAIIAIDPKIKPRFAQKG